MRGFISFIVFPTFNDTVDHCNNDGSLNQEINSEPQLTFRSFTIRSIGTMLLSSSSFFFFFAFLLTSGSSFLQQRVQLRRDFFSRLDTISTDSNDDKRAPTFPAPQPIDADSLYLQQSYALSAPLAKKIVSLLPSTLPPLRTTLRRLKSLTGLTDYSLNTMMRRHPALVVEVILDEGVVGAEEWLKRELGFKISEVRRLVKRGNNRNDIRRKISYYRQTLGMTKKQIRRLLLKKPALLGFSAENHQSKVNFFLEECNFELDQVVKIVLFFPHILAYSVHKMREVVEFLRVDLGLDHERVKRVISGYPQLLTYSVENNLRPSLAFLSAQLKVELTNSQDLSRLVVGFPPVLWLSKENLLPKIEFLRIGMRLTDDELQILVLKFPQALGLR